MSRVIMCDRCEKIIRIVANAVIAHRRYSSRIYSIWTKNRRTEVEEIYLCGDCMKDFERWLKNEN